MFRIFSGKFNFDNFLSKRSYVKTSKVSRKVFVDTLLKLIGQSDLEFLILSSHISLRRNNCLIFKLRIQLTILIVGCARDLDRKIFSILLRRTELPNYFSKNNLKFSFPFRFHFERRTVEFILQLKGHRNLLLRFLLKQQKVN